MEYGFDIDIAKKYGVDEAIMLKNFQFWILKNKASKRHFYDGYYWTYNSARAFSKIFEFWSEKQITRILNSLIEKKVIIRANYNKAGYDRTFWYTIIDETIIPNGKMETPKLANGNSQTDEPIPDINTYTNSDNKHREESPLDLPNEIKIENQEPTENEKLLDEYNRYKNTFKSLIKKYKVGLTEKEIQIITMSDESTFNSFKDIKRRQKFDGDRRLDDFETYAINFMMSTADFTVNNFNLSFFLKHYEKFFEVKKPYEKQEYKTEIQKREEAIGSGSYLTDEWILAASQRDVI